MGAFESVVRGSVELSGEPSEDPREDRAKGEDWASAAGASAADAAPTSEAAASTAATAWRRRAPGRAGREGRANTTGPFVGARSVWDADDALDETAVAPVGPRDGIGGDLIGGWLPGY